MVAGVFSDTVDMGSLQMISLEEYHNFLTKIEWTGTTGEIEGFSKNQNLRISPNPASDYIDIQYSGGENILFFELMNQYGKRIFIKEDLSKTIKFSLDVSNLPSGLYFINLYTESNLVISKKAIIN